MKKIVIAIDSFKGSLASGELADAAEMGIRRILTDVEIVKLPVADGGEGTVEALAIGSGGQMHSLQVRSPLGEPVEAAYGIMGDATTAVIEMAAASGLPLVPAARRNPRKTSTWGTGELIADALEHGCREFIVGIGGSATNDAGTGMLAALGFRFLDSAGRDLPPCGENLALIESVDSMRVHPLLAESRFLVACDVNNPMFGEQGAAYIYARQKGADDAGIVELDAGLRHFAAVMERVTGRDVAHTPGAGAAGALGAGFLAFTNATLRPGIEIVLEKVGFEKHLLGADIVLTGEGRIDSQTAMGKTPAGIAYAAQKCKIPVVAIAGGVADDIQTLHNAGIVAAFSIMDSPMTLEEAMRPATTRRLVAKTAEQIFRLL